MPKIKYINKKFSKHHLDMIQKVNQVVNSYKRQGYNLTLRQVYYQFVARDWFDERYFDPKYGSTNNPKTYKKLGDIVNYGRMAGLIDWNAIEDRTREMDGNSHWSSPQSIVNAVAQQYLINKWEDQLYRPEVYVEKDALEGVIGRPCRELDIPFFSCRGYVSQTAMWNNAQRLKNLVDEGHIPVIVHLGDHDPSGIDMTRDIIERTRQFMGRQGRRLEVKRIALNRDQVDVYNPPPNPAKIKDPRAKEYIRLHGEESWELDALEPTILDRLIREAVEPLRSNEKFNKLLTKEAREKQLLAGVAENWNEVIRFLADNYVKDEPDVELLDESLGLDPDEEQDRREEIGFEDEEEDFDEEDDQEESLEDEDDDGDDDTDEEAEEEE
jgi:hypothetical protein